MNKSTYTKYVAKVSLLWILCFVLLAVIYMTVIRPQSRKRLALEKQIVQAKQLCEAAEAATLEKTRAELEKQLDKFREKIKDYVIDEKNSGNLTFAVSKIANEKNVSEFNIRTGGNQPASGSDFKYIYEKHIDIDFTAGFNQFAGFLNALERYQPVIFVNEFRMSRSNDNPLGHKFNMGLVVLVRKRPE
jgi:Tfp pilus assembly protein PilO